MHRQSMSTRLARASLPLLVGAALTTFSTQAEAGQATLANPPASLRPGQTKTVHELGASLNGAFNPDVFIPAGNWRFHLPSTGRVGQLSGLYMGFNLGPAVSFYGRGRGRYYGRGNGPDDDFHRSVGGRGGFELGYEIDPWSNLALTFSPAVHNDFYFSPWSFQFAQTFGPVVRLYIEQHWVVYFEPGFIGWSVWTDGDNAGAWLSARGGVGFAYKF